MHVYIVIYIHVHVHVYCWFSCSLICSATYTVHSSGEELFLRKFFKFGVCVQLKRIPPYIRRACTLCIFCIGVQTTRCEDKVYECWKWYHLAWSANPEHHSSPYVSGGGQLWPSSWIQGYQLQHSATELRRMPGGWSSRWKVWWFDGVRTCLCIRVAYRIYNALCVYMYSLHTHSLSLSEIDDTSVME